MFNKKRLNFVFLILNIMLFLQVNLKADIPLIKGLHEIFSPDVIGIGQVLKSKGWIENVYDNAYKENLARKVIEKFYHKNDPTGSLMLSGKSLTKAITAKDLGILLKYLRNNSEFEDGRRNALKASLSKKLREDWKNKTFSTEGIIKSLEELKNSKDFMPFTAEAIVFAFFEDKFTKGSKEDALKNLRELLEQILDKDFVGGKLKEEYSHKEYNDKIAEIRGLSADEQIKRLSEEKDVFAAINIEEYRKNIVPPAIPFQPGLKYQYDGKETIDFPTCFESSILDLISYLLYDPIGNKNEYNLDLFAESARGEFLNQIIEKVFLATEKEKTLIRPLDIFSRRQEWINFISNKRNLYYLREEEDKRPELANEKVKFDLNPGINNLIKILNDLFALGIDIQENSKKLIINIKPVDDDIIKIGDEFVIKKPAKNEQKDFIDKILEKLSNRLTTDLRAVTFYSEDIKSEGEFILNENTLEVPNATGKIKVKIEYIESENIKFNSELVFKVDRGHVENSCEIRLIGGLGKLYTNEFKDKLGLELYNAGKINNDFLSIYMLFLDFGMVGKYCGLVKGNKITLPMENLIFYSLPQKKAEQKVEILKLAYINDLFDDTGFDSGKQKFIDSLDDQNAKKLLLDIIEADKDLSSFVSIIEKLVNKISFSNDAKDVIEKFFRSNKDISGFGKLIEKLVDKIIDGKTFKEVMIEILKSNKDISSLASVVEKLADKIEYIYADFIMRTILNSDKDISKLVSAMGKLADKITDSGNVKNVIIEILQSNKDITVLKKIIKELVDKIEPEWRAEVVMEEILKSNKEISFLVSAMEKLADIITDNYYAVNIMSKILKSDKDVSSLVSVMGKLADIITHNADAVNVMIEILESNKGISSLVPIMGKLADKITYSGDVRKVMEKILESNKDISSLVPIVGKLADKIREDYDARNVMEKILESDKDISSLVPIMGKLADKIIKDYDAVSVMEKILESNKKAVSLLPVMEKLADKITSEWSAKWVKEEILKYKENLPSL